ncbi:thymidylate synthase [Candidatus Nanohalobium constans]|uniref:Thymidylate synthase n=1 Tax=Candidatus Nanohalobium constans TaxID=2565781 RepID=A0A5Q0UEQ4_9ARCH|nr:thymidylate synthase [Candidatus Nanohalobium constans]QGA80063.1 thymidylate synthase [Candidatus Nanohalobium constans]
MKQYHTLVKNILENANYRENRTGVDTLSTFSQSYKIDLQEGFPLLTTKDLSGYRWNSLIHELLWYFSGEEHIRNLREETKIWDAWADEEGKLDTAYGRFWRRYPVPDEDSQLPGETWADTDCKWVTEEEDGRLVFDQIKYAIDTLNGDNPDRSPNSRRLVINAWHPSNADVSGLPPCHFTFVMNVQNGKLNTHLTQRSGDTALGIPFNIACYSLITKVIAQQTGFESGSFSHTIVDSHIYCGKGERGEWYRENLKELKSKMREAETNEDYLEIKDWIQKNAPEQEEPYDHVPGLLKQISRDIRERPEMEIADKGVDELEYDDFKLKDYNPHPGIKFAVAE